MIASSFALSIVRLRRRLISRSLIRGVRNLSLIRSNCLAPVQMTRPLDLGLALGQRGGQLGGFGLVVVK